jgi:hypothetical protein
MSIFLLTSTGRSHKLNIAHVVGDTYTPGCRGLMCIQCTVHMAGGLRGDQRGQRLELEYRP